jgi:hypothetical protein
MSQLPKGTNEFIQDLIDNDELGPCLKIEYFFDASHPTPSVPSQDFAKDLTNGSHIILKLAYWFSEELHGYTLMAYPSITGRQRWRRLMSRPHTGQLESIKIKPSDHKEGRRTGYGLTETATTPEESLLVHQICREHKWLGFGHSHLAHLLSDIPTRLPNY